MDVSRLEARLTALEEALRRRDRSPGRRKGFTNQRGAAEYIGRSREWLRIRRLRGEGPPCTPDGRYSYESLDAFMRGDTA
jgi:hypothetical protein